MNQTFNLTVRAGPATNGATIAAANTFYIRPFAPAFSSADTILVTGASAGTLTFAEAGIYLIRIKSVFFSASGTRYLHKLYKNGSAIGLPSTPLITDNVANGNCISINILTLAANDVIDIRGKTNSITNSLDGKAFSQGSSENYLEVYIEKLQATDHALFYYSKAANTAGDNEATTYTGRTLTQSVNTIPSLTLATDTLTFPPGTYRVKTLAAHSGPVACKAIHKFVTASTSGNTNNLGNLLTESYSIFKVPTATSQVYTYQSKVSSVTGTPKMGIQGNQGEIEMYGLVEIIKTV